MHSTLATDELAQAMASTEQSLTTLRVEYEALGARILAESEVLDTLKDEQSRRIMRDAQATGKVLDWAHMLQENQGQAHYIACNKALASLGLISGGFFLETNQRVVKIALYPEKPEQLDVVAASLALVMPAIKPLEDGWCYIAIFEHTLSAGGSFKLRFKPDQSEFQCVRYRYSREDIEQSTSTLAALLPYIQKHHYYD